MSDKLTHDCYVKVEKGNGKEIIEFLSKKAENKAGLEGCNKVGYYGIVNGFVKQEFELPLNNTLPVYTLEEAKKALDLKVVGYKLKEVFSKQGVLSYIPFPNFNLEDFAINAKHYQTTIENFRQAGLLNLWFEPVYELADVDFDMGNFKITKNKNMSLPMKPDTSWCIRVNNEEESAIYRKFFISMVGHKGWDFCIGYHYGFDGVDFTSYSVGELISFEEFKTEIMNKKIIGYVLKDEKYRDMAIKAGGTDNLRLLDAGYSFVKNSTLAERYRVADVLDLWFEPVYENLPAPAQTFDMGEFKLTIKKKGIYHKQEDITPYVEEVIQYAKRTLVGHRFAGFSFNVGDVTLTRTGCEQTESKLSRWVEAWEAYQKMQ